MMDWSVYSQFFKKYEFDCTHSGKNEMEKPFMDKLFRIRQKYDKPMLITSGYRAPEHPIEARKLIPGAHCTGRACDIAVQGADALRLVKIAVDEGMTGIGVQQKGASRFIHLDDLTLGWPRPTIWSYP